VSRRLTLEVPRPRHGKRAAPAPLPPIVVIDDPIRPDGAEERERVLSLFRRPLGPELLPPLLLRDRARPVLRVGLLEPDRIDPRHCTHSNTFRLATLAGMGLPVFYGPARCCDCGKELP
jgi:hypothetical protein